MKKFIYILSILFMTSCATSPTNEEKSVSQSLEKGKSEKKSHIAKEAPKTSKEKESSQPGSAEEPVKQVVPAPPSHYAILAEAIKSQNDEKIYQAATQILAQSANDPKALNALAMYHYKRSRFDLSRFLLNRAINTSPNVAELYSNLGVVQLAQDERREAIKSFRKALEIDSDESVAAANVGAIYAQEKDYAKANIVLETAYRNGVRDARVLNNYAITLTALNKYDKANEFYKNIIKENSTNKEFLYNYAILLIEHMGKFEEGLEVLNRLKFVGGPAETRSRINTLENKAKAGLK